MRRWLLPAAAVAAAAVLAVLLLPRLRPAAAEERPPAVAVMQGRARRGPVARTLRYSGTLSPAATITVPSKVAGRIEEVPVREGQLIFQGDLLAQIEDDALRLEAEQAQAAWQAARAQYQHARQGVRPEELENARSLVQKAQEDFAVADQAFQRSRKLYEAGAMARAAYEQAETAWRAARTGLENGRRTLAMLEEGGSPEEQEMARSQAQARRAAYDLAALQLSYARVLSPVAGIVARVLQEEGNTVAAGTPLVVMVQDDPIVARVAVPELHYGEFLRRRGEIAALVRPLAYPERKPFAGVVTAVAPTIEAASRTFTVEVQLDNASRLLRPGMYCDVELVVERTEAALLVPLSAVVERGDRQVVFVVGGGSPPAAEAREVTLGIESGEEVQILSGLSESDWIVVEGNAFLEDGQALRVVGPQ